MPADPGEVSWQDYVWLAEDVILSLYDPVVSEIDLGDPGMQIARGSVSADSDGKDRPATRPVMPLRVATSCHFRP